MSTATSSSSRRHSAADHRCLGPLMTSRTLENLESESMATATFKKPLMKYRADVQALALSARAFILQSLPGADETVDASPFVAGYGYGAGYKNLICTLLVSKSGVKLGLVGGAELPDPDGLLEGKGKVHRYVQLETASDLKKAGVTRLVQAARAAWQARTK